MSANVSYALQSLRITTNRLVLRLPGGAEWQKLAAEVAGRRGATRL